MLQIMRISQSVCAFGAMALLAAHAGAQTRPNFSGTWTLDADQAVLSGGGRGDGSGRATGGGGRAGGGIGLGPPAEQLVITQDSISLRVEEKRGDASAALVYNFKGAKVKNAMPVGRGASAEATYETKWDGAKLVTKIKRTLTSRAGTTTMEYREVRELATDGTMILETTLSGRPGGRKSIYRRAG